MRVKMSSAVSLTPAVTPSEVASGTPVNFGTCVVCLEDMNNSAPHVAPHDGGGELHHVHTKCLNQLRVHHQNCPTCRAPLSPSTHLATISLLPTQPATIRRERVIRVIKLVAQKTLDAAIVVLIGATIGLVGALIGLALAGPVGALALGVGFAILYLLLRTYWSLQNL